MARRVVEDDRYEDQYDEFGETLSPGVTRPVRPARPAVYQRDSYYGLANLIYGILGIVEVVLLFRLFFLLFGANPDNGFVNFIYIVSRPLVAPFMGIFGQVTSNSSGISVFDPATIIGIVVWAFVAWLIVRLIAAAGNRPANPV